MKTASMMSVVLAAALVAPSAWAQNPRETAKLLDQALAGKHRTPADRARDRFRHPKETLLFFGLRPDMHVVEVAPGMGWYTEVIAPVLRGRGQYYAAHQPNLPEAPAKGRAAFEMKIAKHPEVFGKVAVTSLRPPAYPEAAPAGSADLVLTFRNVHNWAEDGIDQAMFDAFYRALKPGGVLGVVEHRARTGTPIETMKKTGYMTEAYVMALALRSGFRFEAKSEINANPKDTANHPEGVWTLPPTLRMGEKDRAKYVAIGESDRMTLKFVKPGR